VNFAHIGPRFTAFLCFSDYRVSRALSKQSRRFANTFTAVLLLKPEIGACAVPEKHHNTGDKGQRLALSGQMAWRMPKQHRKHTCTCKPQQNQPDNKNQADHFQPDQADILNFCIKIGHHTLLSAYFAGKSGKIWANYGRNCGQSF
jgi:hypothetical protein